MHDIFFLVYVKRRIILLCFSSKILCKQYKLQYFILFLYILLFIVIAAKTVKQNQVSFFFNTKIIYIYTPTLLAIDSMIKKGRRVALGGFPN